MIPSLVQIHQSVLRYLVDHHARIVVDSIHTRKIFVPSRDDDDDDDAADCRHGMPQVPVFPVGMLSRCYESQQVAQYRFFRHFEALAVDQSP